MATLPCPRCGQPRSAHTPCPHCGAPGLTTEVPPLPDVAIPEEATSLPAPIVLPSSVPVAARPQRSETLGRMGYLVAAALSAVGLIFFYGAVWGGNNDDSGSAMEERMAPPEPPMPPEPPAPPAAPDVPRPPGMSESDWQELQRDLREAQREVEQAAREAQREVEQAAREAQREARRAAEEARRR